MYIEVKNSEKPVDYLESMKMLEKRAEAVKNRAMPPIGGDERMAFIKQAEEDYQDYMVIAESEYEITNDYLIFKYKLDS